MKMNFVTREERIMECHHSISEIALCQCPLFLIFVWGGGVQGIAGNTLVLVKFWRSMQLKYSCYS